MTHPRHRPPARTALLLAAAIVAPAGAATSALPDAATEAGLGRLFFTPDERRILDEPPLPSAPPAAVVARPMPAAPPPRRIDGLVRQSSGALTLWLDGTPGPLPQALRAAPFPALELIPRHSPRERLRTGDAWQPPADTPPAQAPLAADEQDARQPE
ncbi:hypothetical protein [Thauera linaloolentis]|uniref:Uncharacterized protein n=1 Tax=Thauera linaloolentis (strain DSM 12138 / JCM 21573 / CCUG 41526 / CIP 105981 / IAM 15112 / NBRC 102519 / 47Lol) TaxID=1123367 RepID=N6ZAK6_THAL4|nr:hypothetical protein [Thauera linaloolentis]ENO89219.1 hypothetical protein C666_07150 [Thauera linaloolentis 47Lol = DSM 12138]MCM8564300.1 hypothetical protein [Thauera linaloolentis]